MINKKKTTKSKNIDLVCDENMKLTPESVKSLAKTGFAVKPDLLEYLKSKVKDSYSSQIAKDNIDKVKNCYIVKTHEGELAYCEGENIFVGIDNFDGLKLHENKLGVLEVVPILKSDSLLDLLDSFVHELNHSAAFYKGVKTNRNGKFPKDYEQFGILNYKGVYRQTMEGINTIITASQLGESFDDYLINQTAVGFLDYMLGSEELKRITVEEPEKTFEIVNKLSGHKDFLGKMELLISINDYCCLALGNEDVVKDTEKQKKYRELYNKSNSVVSGFALVDLMLPKMTTLNSDIAKADYIKNLIRNNPHLSNFVADLYLDMNLNNMIPTEKELKEKLNNDYENLIYEFNDLSYQICPGFALANFDSFNVNPLMGGIYREVIGINCLKAMNDDTRKSYENYVKSVCEKNVGKTVEFDTKVVRPINKRVFGGFLPDYEGEENVYAFEYVAEKLGYDVSNIKCHSSNKTTTVEIAEKEKVDENAYERAYRIFDDVMEKSVINYKGGGVYLDDIIKEW